MTKALDILAGQIREEWLHIPGVIDVTTSVQNKKHCLLVFVRKKTAEIEKKIPFKLNGYSVIIIETSDLFFS